MPNITKMGKRICIDPVDEEMEVFVNSVSILNDFKSRGFLTRKSFIETVMDVKPEYQSYDHVQKLQAFWAGRTKDKDLNTDLEIVLEKLKAE